jgi:DNA adenine methylase
MGSKSRIAKHIIPIIQNYIDDNDINIYVEPFVGGANVIDKIKCRHKFGYDINEYLIELLNAVKNKQELPIEVPREVYNSVRSNKDSFPKWYVGAVGFLASYNGRFFDGGFAQAGYEGKRYRDYYAESKRNILEQADYFQDTYFGVLDYRNSILKNDKGLLIYCDPPYEGTKQFSNSKNFDHKEFWETMRNWSKNNIVLISEQNAPDDFECIWQQEVSRSIKSTDKSTSVEKLFRYKNF